MGPPMLSHIPSWHAQGLIYSIGDSKHQGATQNNQEIQINICLHIISTGC
jgi:hypothetical protein